MTGDPFDPPPHRPDHVDFQHLSEIVLQLDGVAVESDIPAGDVLPHEVGKHADVASVVYMAVMRSIRAKEQGDLSPTAQVVASAMWMDGWIAGVRFQQRYRQSLAGLEPYDRALLAEELSTAYAAEDPTTERGRRLKAMLDQLADAA